MMVIAKEEGLIGVIEKTIENNVKAYPSAVEQLIDIRNILLQNKHTNFWDDDNDEDYDCSYNNDRENDYSENGYSDDEEDDSYSDDNVIHIAYIVNKMIYKHNN